MQDLLKLKLKDLTVLIMMLLNLKLMQWLLLLEIKNFVELYSGKKVKKRLLETSVLLWELNL